MDINEISRRIVDSAYQVHSVLGPGLLESVYHRCLVHELRIHGLSVATEVIVPIQYRGVLIGSGFRLDLLVNDLVVIEIKAVERIHPLHHAQLMTHLKLSNRKLGLLINFNVPLIKEGITRFANGL